MSRKRQTRMGYGSNIGDQQTGAQATICEMNSQYPQTQYLDTQIPQLDCGMSCGELMDLLGPTGDTGGGCGGEDTTILDQWENINFDMDLAMAVLEADTCGEPAGYTQQCPSAGYTSSSDSYADPTSPPQQHQVKHKQKTSISRRRKTQQLEDFDSPCHQMPYGVESDRKLRRREQNRMAARRCRERKKHQRTELVREYYELVSSNAELQSQIQRLQVEQTRLRNTLTSHMTQCPMNTPGGPMQ